MFKHCKFYKKQFYKKQLYQNAFALSAREETEQKFYRTNSMYWDR